MLGDKSGYGFIFGSLRHFFIKCDRYCYKTGQLFYYKMRQKFITKCVKFFIKKCYSFITKCDGYYKMRQFYHKLRQLFLYIEFQRSFTQATMNNSGIEGSMIENN